MNKEKIENVVGYLIVCVLIAALLFAIVVVPAYFESAAYNRLTGANTTTWDAIWLDLRVTEGVKP